MPQQIPTLFKVIIDHDNQKPDLTPSVVSFIGFKAWKERRAELTTAARHFIKRSRGGGSATTG